VSKLPQYELHSPLGSEPIEARLDELYAAVKAREPRLVGLAFDGRVDDAEMMRGHGFVAGLPIPVIDLITAEVSDEVTFAKMRADIQAALAQELGRPDIIVSSPDLEDLLTQVDQAAAAGLYFVGLQTALTIPDIASALEAKDGVTNRRLYRAWFTKWAQPFFPPAGPPGHQVPTLTAERCYWFRCSLLHQATTELPDADIARILFVEGGGVFHLNLMNNVLNLDLRTFCNSMTQAARNWRASPIGKSAVVADNLQRMIRRYPGGWPPIVVGAPVIT
jgi:hypothetical protein